MELTDAIAMHIIGMMLTAVWVAYKQLFDDRKPCLLQDVIDIIGWPVFIMLSVCEFFNLIDRRE